MKKINTTTSWILALAMIFSVLVGALAPSIKATAANKQFWVILDRTDIRCDYKDFSEDTGTHTRKLKVKDTSSMIDDDAEGRYVYCIQPSKNSPLEDKKYYVSKFADDDTDGKFAKMRTVMWHSPGFAGRAVGKALLAQAGLDNDAEHNYGYAHAALAYLYGASDWNSGLYESTQNKIKTWINLVLEHADDVPGNFKIYVCKTESDRQDFVGGFYEQTGFAKIMKTSSNPDITNNNACYDLAGAEYTVYDDQNLSTIASTAAGGEAVLVTKSSGDSDPIELVEGTYWVKETKAAKGYGLDPKTYSIEVDANETVTLAVKDAPQADPIPILLHKLDKETGEAYPVEKGTLRGAQYEIHYQEGNRTWVWETDENGFIYPPTNTPVSGSETYNNGDGRNVFPIGHYTVQEKQPADGYLKDETVYNIEVVGQNNVVDSSTGDTITVIHTFNETDPAVTSEEQIKRGSFSFYKLAEDTQEAMGGVQFKLTALKTGESHELMTDENGFYDSELNPHSSDTNGGNVDSGLWFGTNANGTTSPVDDDNRALPYGEYELEELRSDANEGKQLVKRKFTISRDDYALPTITLNDKNIEIGTTMTDSVTMDHEANTSTESVFIDEVTYENVTVGKEYTMKGQLYVKNTGEPLMINDEPITSETTFTPDKTKGKVALEFRFDSSKLKGQSIVAFEHLYEDETEIASHADIDDKGQTVKFGDPQIGTTLVGDDNAKVVINAEKVTLKDIIHYKGLTKGQKYKVVGKLMVKDTGDPLVENGEEVTAEAEFTAKAASGDATVEFVVDTRELVGKELVAFETVYDMDGDEVATHEDLEDEGQTVKIGTPRIGTTLHDKAGNKHVIKNEKTVLVDVISYEGLTPGQKYKAVGKLMVKDTKKALEQAGKKVTAKAEFTPKKPAGTTEVSFNVDTKGLVGKELVAFETVYDMNGKEVAKHEDIKDKGQTIQIVNEDGSVKTSDNTFMIMGIIGCMMALAAAGYGYITLKKRKLAFAGIHIKDKAIAVSSIAKKKAGAIKRNVGTVITKAKKLTRK